MILMMCHNDIREERRRVCKRGGERSVCCARLRSEIVDVEFVCDENRHIFSKIQFKKLKYIFRIIIK